MRPRERVHRVSPLNRCDPFGFPYSVGVDKFTVHYYSNAQWPFKTLIRLLSNSSSPLRHKPLFGKFYGAI